MTPHIDKTTFGSITVAGHKYKHDLVIGQDGNIRKRRKELSKAEYGTSHKISLAEARDIFEEGLQNLLISSGLFDSVRFSEEAAAYFKELGVEVVILPTPKAIRYWNNQVSNLAGLFHITC